MVESPLRREPAAAREPFVDDELASISLEARGIDFHFRNHVLQIGGDFSLCEPGGLVYRFRPGERSGKAEELSELIGRTVAAADWSDLVVLTFDNGFMIRIDPVSGGFRGAIVGKHPPPGTLVIEDF